MQKKTDGLTCEQLFFWWVYRTYILYYAFSERKVNLFIWNYKQKQQYTIFILDISFDILTHSVKQRRRRRAD